LSWTLMKNWHFQFNFNERMKNVFLPNLSCATFTRAISRCVFLILDPENATETHSSLLLPILDSVYMWIWLH
jgi:hypothetical protein